MKCQMINNFTPSLSFLVRHALVWKSKNLPLVRRLTRGFLFAPLIQPLGLTPSTLPLGKRCSLYLRISARGVARQVWRSRCRLAGVAQQQCVAQQVAPIYLPRSWTCREQVSPLAIWMAVANMIGLLRTNSCAAAFLKPRCKGVKQTPTPTFVFPPTLKITPAPNLV